jgi:tRNA(Ile)-lysidine synthetase-like protein
VEEVVLDVGRAAREIEKAASGLASRLGHEPGVHVEAGVLAAPAALLRAAGRFTRAAFLRQACDHDPAFGHATWGLYDAFERAATAARPFEEEVRRGVILTARSGLVALFAGPDLASFGAGASARAVVRLPAGPGRELVIEPLAPAAVAPTGAVALHVPPGAGLLVRPRRAGDRFRLGPHGTKLVAEELSDRKIQPVWRSRIPLLFVDGELRWIAGVRAIRGEGAPNVTARIAGPMPWALPYR